MFKPLADRVLIRPDARPTQTPGGLHLPEDAWKPEYTGVVVAVGEARCARCRETQDPPVREGDRVVFSYTSGQELLLNGGEDRLLIMRVPDLLAVLEA